MAKARSSQSSTSGYSSRTDGPVSAQEFLAGFIAVLWFIGSAGYFLLMGPAQENGMQFLLTLLIVVLPVGLLWIGVMAARAARIQRDHGDRLDAAIDALGQARVTLLQKGTGEAAHPDLLRKLDEISAVQMGMAELLALQGTVSPPEQPSEQPPDQDAPDTANPQPLGPDADVDDTEPVPAQPGLGLDNPAGAQAATVSNADFIRALHFPENEDDKEGFDALRRALQDHSAGQLIQAAQDILTLMSEDGIYMDDLRPDFARAEIWRAFARGTRGREVAALGGIHHRESLARTTARMKQDTIFRDAAHHFLRSFDKAFAEFEQRASDAEITQLASTRSARAFMLLGRAAGTFD